MTKQDALDLLSLTGNPKPEAVDLRYKQIAAFFEVDSEPDLLHDLWQQLKPNFDSAYGALPHKGIHTGSQDGNEKNGAGTDVIPQPPAGPGLMVILKNVVFPHPTGQAGPVFSDSWWTVYKRATLLALALIGFVFYTLPEHITWPSWDVTPAPNPSPSPSPSPSPGPEPSPGPTPVPIPVPGPTPSPWNTTTDTSTGTTTSTTTDVTPAPTPIPITVPQQEPDKYVFSIMAKLKDGGDPEKDGMIKTPVPFSVRTILYLKHDQTPYYSALPLDALKTIIRGDTYATVRVKERYFTGSEQINDYSLVAENGVWKLADVQTAKMADPGDPIAFVFDHFAAISHGTIWQAYANYDSSMQATTTTDSIKRDYQNWYVPTLQDRSKALILESITPDATNPTEATVKLLPYYFTMTPVETYLTHERANLLIDLVNEEGHWKIHNIRRVPAISYGDFAPKFSPKGATP